MLEDSVQYILEAFLLPLNKTSSSGVNDIPVLTLTEFIGVTLQKFCAFVFLLKTLCGYLFEATLGTSGNPLALMKHRNTYFFLVLS